jgi:hypothetical protein
MKTQDLHSVTALVYSVTIPVGNVTKRHTRGYRVEQFLVSQRQAVGMLRQCGLSRRAAYYRLTTIPSRVLVDSKVFSRVDVELLCEKVAQGLVSLEEEAS